MNQLTGDPGNKQAQSLDEIKPLIDMCRKGRLFAVQEWIAERKPVNPPPFPRRSNHARAPLDIAVESGFHSLIEVLLKGGATIDLDDWNGTMARALRKAVRHRPAFGRARIRPETDRHEGCVQHVGPSDDGILHRQGGRCRNW